jgi:hypothetical protein
VIVGFPYAQHSVGFMGTPLRSEMRARPAEPKRLEEVYPKERTVKQTHLKAFNHLTLPPPPSPHCPETQTRRAGGRGHASRAAWDPRTCNRPVHMEGRLVHGLVSSIQRHHPKHGQMRLMCCH